MPLGFPSHLSQAQVDRGVISPYAVHTVAGRLALSIVLVALRPVHAEMEMSNEEESSLIEVVGPSPTTARPLQTMSCAGDGPGPPEPRCRARRPQALRLGAEAVPPAGALMCSGVPSEPTAQRAETGAQQRSLGRRRLPCGACWGRGAFATSAAPRSSHVPPEILALRLLASARHAHSSRPRVKSL